MWRETGGGACRTGHPFNTRFGMHTQERVLQMATSQVACASYRVSLSLPCSCEKRARVVPSFRTEMPKTPSLPALGAIEDAITTPMHEPSAS